MRKKKFTMTCELCTPKIRVHVCVGSQIMKGAHKRYHKLCWLWCYPSLFRNRDTEW
ncbi:Os01g0521200 [Oryza sativa Japonica Group]|uniref:Os01g0521200 protein n=1 Tax=Oryza sativa subsp. japonica TaxID=39947 RepID=A0A0P0V3D2_ORYSJ|nr:hypothetical protein EE612_003093 [Oryza sativa]BAS72452.1 Os01g0521200 [Oryza sativa Japonica Group]